MATSASFSLQITLWNMDVTWNSPVATSWTVSPDTVTMPPGEITLSRPEPYDPDEDVDAVEVGDDIIEPDDPDVIYWLRGEIKLRLPVGENPDDEPPPPTIPISIHTFSGNVPLGSITITYADLSGIYRIDDSIHHDALYDRSGTGIVLSNTAIPTPTLITSYIADPDENVSHFTGTRMRVTGAGFIKQVFESLDNINNERLVDLRLTLANNVEPFQLANFVDQRASLRIYIEGLDAFFVISKILIFNKAIFTGYPQ